MSANILDLLIIGGGPAGVGAAIQARLYGLKTLIVSMGDIGGRLALARRVENFPAAAGRKASGPAICRLLEKWLKERKISVASDFIAKVERTRGLFRLKGKSGRTYRSRALIIATGARPMPWRISGGPQAGDRIVESWRQITRPRGACVAVIGGGEVAFDQALSLAERGAEVLLLMRGKRPRAHPGLAAEAARLGVSLIKDMPMSSVRCDGSGAMLEAKSGQRFRCDYILPAVGHRPQLPEIDRFARKLQGCGLWLAGDVREAFCRQAAVAFGDGVRAAMLAWRYLQKERA